MKKLLILTFLLLSFSAFAQKRDSTNMIKTGFYVNVMTVSASSALDDLNQQLRAAGQLPVTAGLFGVSAGFTSRFADQNSYGAARLSLLTTADEDPNENQATQLTVWELSVMGHYDLLPNPNWLVYPYLGIGTSYARLAVSSVEPGNNFQNSLSNPGDDEIMQKKYGALMIFGELGGGIERILRFSNTDAYLGISGGYRLSTDEPWSLNNVKAFDNASFNTNGWMFEFKFRVEMNPKPGEEAPRGLYKFFN